MTPTVFNSVLAVPKQCCLCSESHSCHQYVHAALSSGSSLVMSILGTETFLGNEAGCQETTCIRVSRSASLENRVTACAQAIRHCCQTVVSLESCVAKTGRKCWSYRPPTNRSNVALSVQNWTSYLFKAGLDDGFLACASFSDTRRTGNAFVNVQVSENIVFPTVY